MQAIGDAEKRHGKLARALLLRVESELDAQGEGRCETCGRSSVKLTAAQVTSALKAGVEVERVMRLKTRPEKGSISGFTINPQTGRMQPFGDGSQTVLVTAKVVDGAGVTIGDLSEIAERAVHSWQQLFSEFGIPLTGANA